MCPCSRYKSHTSSIMTDFTNYLSLWDRDRERDRKRKWRDNSIIYREREYRVQVQSFIVKWEWREYMGKSDTSNNTNNTQGRALYLPQTME